MTCEHVYEKDKMTCMDVSIHVDGGYTHWALLYDGKYYDPEFGLIEGEYIHGKITSFLAIYQ